MNTSPFSLQKQSNPSGRDEYLLLIFLETSQGKLQYKYMFQGSVYPEDSEVTDPLHSVHVHLLPQGSLPPLPPTGFIIFLPLSPRSTSSNLHVRLGDFHASLHASFAINTRKILDLPTHPAHPTILSILPYPRRDFHRKFWRRHSRNKETKIFPP